MKLYLPREIDKFIADKKCCICKEHLYASDEYHNLEFGNMNSDHFSYGWCSKVQGHHDIIVMWNKIEDVSVIVDTIVFGYKNRKIELQFDHRDKRCMYLDSLNKHLANYSKEFYDLLDINDFSPRKFGLKIELMELLK
jgi:hypothetical protein